MKSFALPICVLLSSLVVLQPTARAQESAGTAFTYQGRLEVLGELVNDTADFQFTLWDAEIDGMEIGALVEVSGVTIEDGLVAIALDFGVEVFGDQARWLEMTAAVPAGSGNWATLSPRQRVTPTPYALQTRGIHVSDDQLVGIGTVTPGAPLHIKGTRSLNGLSFTSLALEGDAFVQQQFVTNGNLHAAFEVSDTGDFAIFSGTGSMLTTLFIKNGGNVGIGTSTPSERLHVIGNVQADGYLNNSDRRFKRNVAPITGALATVLELRGVRFDWDRQRHPKRGFGPGRQVGFIAQDIERVIPELVAHDDAGFLSVDYGRITPVLVEAIKELHEEVTEKECQIDDLTARLQRMEAVVDGLVESRATNAN